MSDKEIDKLIGLAASEGDEATQSLTKISDETPAVCGHGVTFDEEEFKTHPGMTTAEVRKRWPRGSGRCQNCGFEGIAYASFMHYIAGDW